MIRHLPTALATIALAASLTGCGAVRAPLAVQAPSAGVRAADESDHQQMNAIVRGVLTASFKDLPVGADGALTKAAFAEGKGAAVVALYFKAFDLDGNGAVTPAEHAKALATDAPVEAFHHFTEEVMSADVKPYAADNDFDATDLRAYMTKSLDLTADFPLLFKLMGKLDLNQDDKLLSAKGEGPAFMLTFAQPTLQHALGVASSLPADELKKAAKKR